MKASLVIRRVHMYLALFLTPWVIVYAVSTIAMNHRDPLRKPPVFVTERTEMYTRPFAPDAKPADKARQILADLHLEGMHNVNTGAGGQRLTILRQDPIAPRRITYTSTDNKLLVEKQQFAMPAFVERMHRRRGYQHPYALDVAWAITVDLVIVAILFWALSGLWMWWEMKKTRAWGAVCAVAGCAVFALFLATI